jgi:hypothetical protein
MRSVIDITVIVLSSIIWPYIIVYDVMETLHELQAAHSFIAQLI